MTFPGAAHPDADETCVYTVIEVGLDNGRWRLQTIAPTPEAADRLAYRHTQMDEEYTADQFDKYRIDDSRALVAYHTHSPQGTTRDGKAYIVAEQPIEDPDVADDYDLYDGVVGAYRGGSRP